MPVYFMAIWSILRPFGIFCSHLVYFTVIWYIFPFLVCCTKKKSGNPGQEVSNERDIQLFFRQFVFRHFRLRHQIVAPTKMIPLSKVS
jgi:hypothetical protein